MDDHFDRLFRNDAYEVVEDSDQERADSSDDDVDIILHGTMQQIKKLQRRNQGRASSSEEDEFEKEMTSELDKTMKDIEESYSVSVATVSMPEASTEKVPSFYDNSYFDSDSDEEGTSEEKKNRKHPVLTNDELFYDPEMDDKDQKWIDDKRRAYQPKRTSSTARHQSAPASDKPRPLPSSDAVLNCPGCMSLLCLDCQRHTTYSHQYRAMFVTNCAPDMSEVLQHSIAKQSKQKKSNKRKRIERTQEGGGSEDFAQRVVEAETTTVDELYHPVRCDLCKTEVAVYDKDEVYHFYNVLASY